MGPAPSEWATSSAARRRRQCRSRWESPSAAAAHRRNWGTASSEQTWSIVQEDDEVPPGESNGLPSDRVDVEEAAAGTAQGSAGAIIHDWEASLQPAERQAAQQRGVSYCHGGQRRESYMLETFSATRPRPRGGSLRLQAGA
mmetsp:Transcript_70193/g.168228  ORF Transcript_70193/g.168228 Transcript_70193/m.168228 type:complete len:142 (+) Transcript_70193:588-1013(+)